MKSNLRNKTNKPVTDGLSSYYTFLCKHTVCFPDSPRTEDWRRREGIWRTYSLPWFLFLCLFLLSGFSVDSLQNEASCRTKAETLRHSLRLDQPVLPVSSHRGCVPIGCPPFVFPTPAALFHCLFLSYPASSFCLLYSPKWVLRSSCEPEGFGKLS